MALASSSRNGARIIWVCLHTAEGSRRRSDLYHFFDTVRSGSSHGGADGTGLDDGWVPDDQAAWTLLNGNPRSLNLEMCGFARWSRAQWLSEGTVDGVVNPRQMIRNAAEWVRRKCDKHGIPRQHIGSAGVAAGRPGVIMHWDYTVGASDGDHTDIGGNFPWDVLFADVNGTSSEDDMPSANDIWMAPLRLKTGPGPKDYEEHPAVEWITVMAQRIAWLERQLTIDAKWSPNTHVANVLVSTYKATGADRGVDLASRVSEDKPDLLLSDAQVQQLGALLSKAVTRLSDDDVARLARAAQDEADRRTRDNDPETGPTT